MLGSLLRSLAPSCLAALTLGAGMLCARPASALSPFLVTPEASVVEASPAYRYANMTDDEAIAELDRRSLPYVRVEPVPGVRAPIRLTGRLHGVSIHSALPEEQRATSVFEILDARLALALDDFTAVLERHEIDELIHYTMYRPNVPREVPAPVAVKKESAKKEAPKKDTAKKEAPKKETPKAEVPKTNSKLSAGNAAKAPDLGKGALGDKPSHEGAAKGTKHKAPAAVQAKPREMVTASVKPKSAPRHAPKAAPHHAPAKAEAKAEAKAAPGKPDVQASPAKTEAHAAAPTKTVPHPRWAPPGTRHPAGLAIDVGRLRKKDGTWISVLDHFHGKIGEKTCGEGARKPEQPVAQELRALVCESQDTGIFTYVLSPNYNTDHADHFHMEIKPGVRWFLVH
ncbi:MAG TPA: extensin family protein [Polyangium sp.]|nr:extensin family protein [Polyangium sp.]